ncbi:MAG: alpha/beta hydrolase, partial [Leptospiraceae bacterium]|nr:alpha/beta hydrolase [Leptospiraceae bacterium]
GPLLRDLSGQFHIVAPDLPGFGATPAVEGQSHGARAQAERLAEFLNELGIRRFTLLGFSMGGGVAADYASRHADRVDRLILLSAYGVRTVEESDGLKKYKEDRSNGIYFKTAEGFDRVMNVASENPPFLPGPIKEYIAKNIGAPHYSMHKRILEEMVFGDPGLDAVRSRLGRLTMPALILFGNHDRIINPEAAGIFHRGIRGSEMAILSDCGHMVYLDCAAETNRQIEDFLTEHKAASSDQVVRSDSDNEPKKAQP